MPKVHTFPTLYDELKTITINFLAKYEFLRPNQTATGTISWSKRGNNTGSILVTVNTQSPNKYLELNYTCNTKPICYRVQLITVPSNLGKGVVWYFVCPHTGKRCRKLYLADTYFYHRSAFRGCMYEKQTLSKRTRNWDKHFACLYLTEKIYQQINAKHFKKTYAGKPTKRYLKLTQQIERAESIPLADIERILLG